MIGGVLGLGRGMAEARMTDSCKITRNGEPALDEDTGEYVTTEVVVYSGPCRIKHPATAGRDVDAGSQLVVVSQLELHVPVSAVGVQADDTVTVTGSGTREEQAGRKFTILAPFDGSQTTALRFRIEVADGR